MPTSNKPNWSSRASDEQVQPSRIFASPLTSAELYLRYDDRAIGNQFREEFWSDRTWPSHYGVGRCAGTPRRSMHPRLTHTAAAQAPAKKLRSRVLPFANFQICGHGAPSLRSPLPLCACVCRKRAEHAVAVTQRLSVIRLVCTFAARLQRLFSRPAGRSLSHWCTRARSSGSRPQVAVDNTERAKRRTTVIRGTCSLHSGRFRSE